MEVVAKMIALFAALTMSAPQNATAFSSRAFVSRRLRQEVPVYDLSTSVVQLSRSSSDGMDNDDTKPSFDMNELQKRMDQQMTQYYDLLMGEDTSEVRPEFVYLIVFNPDNEETQGVHTIEFPKGSGDNIILAFESDDDCIEFAQMLKNVQFFKPVPQMANLSELEVFCQGLGVPVKVVPQGKKLRPPADNVEEFTMNPNLRQDKQKLNRAFIASDEDNGDCSSEGLGSAWE